MDLQQTRQKIIRNISIFVTQIKANTAFGQTDINKISEIILIPLFAEIYGWHNLKNLNYTETMNCPGIDLGDEDARVAIQVTATPTNDKVKDALHKIDPKLPVQFEWLMYGSRRLLLMHVYPSMPPYTTTSGKGWMRIRKDCKPLTGSLLRQLREKAGLNDPTATVLPIDEPLRAISPAAHEILRREMNNMGAPGDLLACDDPDLCAKLGFLKHDRLTMAGLLVAGREEVIALHAPNHEWKYSRMRTDTDYEAQPVGGRDCILSALDKIMLLLRQNNPVTTVPSGLFHPEFPQYPIIALREALLNAFAHRDYSIPGMVFIRHYRDRFEINSPGGFAGGVTPENILHHPPVTRNRYLVETVLLATRLVNRQNLGVPRIFRALLEEGKEPPAFDEIGQTVRVTFPGQKVDKSFKALLS